MPTNAPVQDYEGLKLLLFPGCSATKISKLANRLLSKNFGRYNFRTLESSKNSNIEIFCIQKFKRPKFFKHYFSIENLHTEHLNINE